MGDDASPDDPTQHRAVIEAETQSVYAWGLAEVEDDPPPARLTPRRITIAAVTASLLAVSIAGVLAWQHLRTEQASNSDAATSMIDAPPPPPAATVTVTAEPEPPVATPRDLDEAFWADMRAQGWTVSNPNLAASRAREVCGMLRGGSTAEFIVRQMLLTTGPGPYQQVDISRAQSFVSTAMSIYPDCP